MSLQNNSLFRNSCLVVLVALKMIAQYLVVNPVYDLQRDEYLHLDQANHLAWGFQSVPPITSWISWIILQLGNTYFWIKFFPALFGALTIFIVWKTVESLKGGLYACLLTAVALLFSPFLRLNMLYQPNSLDVLCWTTLFYGLIRYIQTTRPLWLYFMAVTFAIGFLNKYNIAFCLLGLLPALIFSKHRTLFLRPHLYFAIVLASILIMPNLIWQMQNGFPVFKHLKELNETQLVHVNRWDFLKEQLLFFIGSLFVLFSAFVSLYVYKPFKPYRVLFWSFLFTTIVFIWLRAKGYYALGLYPIFMAFGAIYLSEILKEGWKYYLSYVAIAVILLLFVPMLKIALPIFSPEKYAQDAKLKRPFSTHTWEDGQTYPISQDFADMLGWREMASKVDSAYRNLPDKGHVFILCDNYGEAGAINYYGKEGLVASSFNADYVNWMDLSSPIKTIIRVKEASNKDERELSLFNKADHAGTINTQYAREKGTKIIVLSQPVTDINTLLRQERVRILR